MFVLTVYNRKYDVIFTHAYYRLEYAIDGYTEFICENQDLVYFRIRLDKLTKSNHYKTIIERIHHIWRTK